jgi:hypothetical protein
MRVPIVLACIASAISSHAFAQHGIAAAHGVVYDSLRGAPFANAVVAIVGGARTTTDRRGQFRFDSVTTGVHTFVVQADALDSVGFSGLSTRATVGSDDAEVVIALPSFATLWMTACGATPIEEGHGFVFGTVRNARDGAPVGDATVDVTWLELHVDATHNLSQRRWRGIARSDVRGSYAVCGVPTSIGLRIKATNDFLESGLIDLTPRDIRVQRRDLLVGPVGNETAAARGTIVGVLTTPNGQAFTDARIVSDDVPEARSDNDGRFILRSVPTGTRQIEILSLGMMPFVTTVDVVPHDTVSLAVTVRKITTLDVMRVTATARQQRFINGFAERRTSGFGYAKDSSEMFGTISSVFSGFPGVQAQYTGVGRRDLSLYLPSPKVGLCLATLIIDGVKQRDNLDLASMRTEDLAAVEVFPHAYTVPLEFMAADVNCGVVAVWTKFAFR